MSRMILTLFLALLAAACATQDSSSSRFPAVSPEGLQLVPDTRLRAVYLKPGADLSQYDRVALLEAYVSFAKNWQRDYNESANFEHRVSDRNMKEIRKKVAEEFNREMTRVLTRGGRQIVAEGSTGVLIVRPAIVNLQITAPDVMAPGIDTTYVASAGSMTLYMELLDGKTGELIARVIDPEAADNAGIAQVANSVTNTADFDRVVRRWAQILNDHLADVTGGT